MKKTIFIKLRRSRAGLGGRPLDVYYIESLRNAAQVQYDIPGLPVKKFRVGDEVTPTEADVLCNVREYDVTINN